MTDFEEPAILLPPPVVPSSVDLPLPIAMPDPKPALSKLLFCDVIDCSSTTELPGPEMEVLGWRHDGELGWMCPKHFPPSLQLIDAILAGLERLPAYTVRAEHVLPAGEPRGYSDPHGQWVMFADVKRMIEKFRG